MADVRPFPGLRFDPHRVNVGAAVCPPYDVMSPAEQQAYHDRDPHNMVRVELGLGPADERAPENRYATAAAALDAWQREGILVRDQAPAFYLHEHTFPEGGHTLTRRGVFVAGRLHDWSEGEVLPHEGTRSGPKQDRLALLRATHTNVSPLWLLYDDADGAVAAALGAAWQAAPLLTAEVDGEWHLLRAVSDPDVTRAVTAAFQGRPLYIADGHHRYETAQIYRDERRAAARASGSAADPDAGYEFALMMLIAMDDPGLRVLPYHRLVRQLGRPTEQVRDALARWLTIAPLALPAGDDAAVAAALDAALAEAGRQGHAFALYEHGGAWLLRPRPDADWPALLPAGHSDAWRALDVSVLDALIIREVLGIEAQSESSRADATSHAPSDRLLYPSDTAAAVRAVRAGEAEQAYLLNPTRVEQVCAVATARDRMPPKSTFFAPKPVTGLVMHPLDGRR
jgi:uncharacterized protein (DUF1015 family)